MKSVAISLTFLKNVLNINVMSTSNLDQGIPWYFYHGQYHDNGSAVLCLSKVPSDWWLQNVSISSLIVTTDRESWDLLRFMFIMSLKEFADKNIVTNIEAVKLYCTCSWYGQALNYIHIWIMYVSLEGFIVGPIKNLYSTKGSVTIGFGKPPGSQNQCFFYIFLLGKKPKVGEI